MPERFCLWSEHGDEAFVGLRLQREGHTVVLRTNNPRSKYVYRGLLPRTNALLPNSTVLFDSTGEGARGRHLRNTGYGVIGGNPIDTQLEDDRATAFRLIESLDIRVPEWHLFRSVPEATRFLTKNEGEWFFKPNGDPPVALTEGPASSEKLIRWLGWAAPQLADPASKITSFVLQRKVDGLEIDVDGWFDGRRWVWPFCATIEDKKSATGDLGPRAGCAANLVWCWLDDLPPLVERTLARLTPTLEQAGYVGNIGCNMILDDGGTPNFLELTARSGFKALQAYLLLVEGDLGAQLAAFARGQLDRWQVRDDAMALTVTVGIPPYPIEEATDFAAKFRGLPVDARFDGTHPRLFPDDVMLEGGIPRAAGRDGTLGDAAAVGSNLADLRAQALALAKELDAKGKVFRLDPVVRAERVFAALENFGYDDGRLTEEVA